VNFTWGRGASQACLIISERGQVSIPLTPSHPPPSHYRRMAVTMEGEVAGVTKDAESKMKKCVDSTDNNLKAIRTGRAS